jgi:hypothetical protein
MLRIRNAAAGAVLVIAIASSANGSATAQTATMSAPGRPLPLLQIGHQAAAATHVRTPPRLTKRRFAKTHRKTHRNLLARNSRSERVQTATEEMAATAPPAPDATRPAPRTAAVPQSASVFPDPPGTFSNRLVVGGQTVQVAAPNDVNALDLAAGDAGQTADATSPVKDAAPPADTQTRPVVRAMIASPAPAELAEPSSVGSVSWIAQVLAALGGAIAAGTVAWFLIGPAPLRRYS